MPEDLKLDYPTVSKGERPNFFENKDIDQLMTFIVALLNELMVTRDRLDTVERLLAEDGTLSLERMEAFTPDEKQTTEKNAIKREIIRNVLRIHR